MAAVAATDGDGGGSAPATKAPPSSSGLLGQTILDELTPPANVHLDDTAQNRLKKLQPVLDALLGLTPIFNQWKACQASQQFNGGPTWDEGPYGAGVEQQQLPKLTMGFGAIYSPYSRMNQMHSAGQALESIAQNASGALGQYWAGAAADAATTKLDDLKYASQEYTQTLESLSPHVLGLWTTSTNAVQKLADFADSADGKAIVQYGKDASGKGADIGHEMTSEAVLSYIEQINLAIKNGLYFNFWDTPEPSSSSSDNTISAAQLRSAGKCKLDGGHGGWWTDQACAWFDKFGDAYNSAVKNLRAQITQTYNAVDQALGDFTSQISSIPSDPFGKLQAPGQAAPAQNGSSSSNGSSSGGSNSGSRSGSPVGSGGGGGGGTSASSFTPPPTSPSTVGAGGGGGSPTGNVNPSNPNGKPAMPTIPPISTPGSPVAGTPVGTTTTQGAQGTPESMTVQSGNNQISMTSPDAQGNVHLSVNNGSGMQTYNIGFGQGTATSGVPGGPGGPGAPGGPGTPGQMMPAHIAGPVIGQAPGQGVPQQITPGANGAAVIHDGNLTITATEPHGAHGPVQVTVDDGTGHPQTYTLNPGSNAAGGGTPMQPLSGTNPANAFTGPVQQGYGIPAGVQGHNVSADGQGYGIPAGGQSHGGGDPSGYTSGAAFQGGDPSASGVSASYQPDPSTQSASWLAPGTDPSSHAAAASNVAHGFGGGAGGGGVGGGGGSPLTGHEHLGGAVSGAPISPADHTGGMVSSASNHEVSGVGLASTNVSNPGAPGGVGMAGGPGEAGGQSGGGGMPMMGGMGGMGGGGQGQDQERGASQWRVRGDLFGDESGPLEVPRVIGDEDQ